MKKKDSKILDTSADDFQTPIPPKIYKKLSLETKPKVSNSNKNKKGTKTRQLKLRTVIEQNLEYTDVNPEHLQVALALSKSTYEEQNKVKEKEFDWTIFRRKPEKLQTTLNSYPKEYKCNTKKQLKNQKRSKFRYVTPILMMRSEDERESLIQSQLAQILSNNIINNECHNDNSDIELFSEKLKYLRCSECCMFKINYATDVYSNFKVAELNIPEERSKCGYLLKDWKQILFRDHSPELEIPEKKSDYGDSKNSDENIYPDNCNVNVLVQNDIDASNSECFSSVKSNYIPPEKQSFSVLEDNVGEESFKYNSPQALNKIKDQNSESIQCVPVSPDLFDDENLSGFISESSTTKRRSHLNSSSISSEEPVTENSKISSSSRSENDIKESARKSLGSIFSKEAHTDVMENMSNNIIEYSKIHSESGICHYDVFNSNSDIDFINISSEDDDTGVFDKKEYIMDDMNVESSSKQGILHSTITNRKYSIEKEIFKNDQVDLTSTKLSSPLNDNFSSDEDLPIINTSSRKQENNSSYSQSSSNNSFQNDSKNQSIESPIKNSSKGKIDSVIEKSRNEASGFDCNPRFSSSLNITDHIEEILAKNYSNIDSLKLSDVEYERTPEVKNSYNNVTSSKSVSNELEILMTKPNLDMNGEFNCYDNDNSSQNSEDPIYISDEELNYSSTSRFQNNKELKLDTFEDENLDISERTPIGRFASFCRNYVPINRFSVDDEILPTVRQNEIVELENENPSDSDGFEIGKKTENTHRLKKLHVRDEENNTKDRLLKKYASFTETSTPTHSPRFSRNKSESCITPVKKVKIKTENVTPMTNYDAMSTPEIHQELDKFGLKPLKRKRGTEFLKYIYEATHPLLKSKDINSGSKKFKRGVISNRETVNDISHEDAQLLLLEEPCFGRISESEWILEKQRSKKNLTCLIPLQLVWHNFLAANPNIKEKILLYEPLEIGFLHKSFKNLGYNFHSEDIIKFLDSKCITIRVSQGHKNPKSNRT